ncbi:MAG: SH3 domain-containing protein [Bacteroidota bacterium]
MKKVISTLFFLASLSLFPFQDEGNLVFFVTAESGLSIREKPSLKSKKIGLLAFQTKVVVKKVLAEKLQSIYDEGLKISANWVQIENPLNPSLESYIFGGFLQQKDFKEDQRIDTSDWINFKIENHNIILKQPQDWLNMTKNVKYLDQGNDSTILVTHEDGVDPTQVIIRAKNRSLETIENEIISKGWFKKIEEIVSGGKKILKCTYFFDNGCSNVRYFHKVTKNRTYVVEVSGTCNSHPEGYDESKIMVAESIKFSY